MKTKDFEKKLEVLAAYALTSEEMLTVRGGEGDGGPGTTPPVPPVKV